MSARRLDAVDVEDDARQRYLLDNQAVEAGARFEALSTLFDPSTFRHMRDLGIEEGWRCWEVGAGGSSVIRWLAEQVGSGGHVLATDIDLSSARDPAGPSVELRSHDVGRDASPLESFDLVHARLVLVHVRARNRALRSMAEALRPGGWLLVEDADPALQPLSCLEPRTPEEHLANKLRGGFRTLLSERGVDLAYGRKLPRLLRDAGLADVGADAYFPVALSACARLELATVKAIRDDLVSHRVATPEEVERHLASVTAGKLDLAQPPMISAWGRRT